MNKRVAISIWNDRVSPVMDFAQTIMIVDYDEDVETSRMTVNIPQANHAYKVEFLKSQNVNLLICGAISMPLYRMLTASEIEVAPFIRGSIEPVLAAHLEGQLYGGRFFLPGCRRNALKLGGGHHGTRRRCCRKYNELKED